MKDERKKEGESKHTAEGQAKYKQLNNELRIETERARSEWWDRECEEMEELGKRGRTDLVYAKAKQLTRKSGSVGRSLTIKAGDGKLITEPDKVRDRWKDYIETYMTRKENRKQEMWKWRQKLVFLLIAEVQSY